MNYTDKILCHYGVKGMRWRHRKGRKANKSSAKYYRQSADYFDSLSRGYDETYKNYMWQLKAARGDREKYKEIKSKADDAKRRSQHFAETGKTFRNHYNNTLSGRITGAINTVKSGYAFVKSFIENKGKVEKPVTYYHVNKPQTVPRKTK